MNAVIDLRHIPIGMEGFPAIDQEQMSYIKRLIDECDYYVVIVKDRYGSTAPNGVSFTEQEYEYAVSAGKHVLGFLSQEFDEKASDNPDAVKSFREKISSNRIVKFWGDKTGLEMSVLKSLSAAFEADPREGWIRASSAADPKIIQELADARSQILNLEREIAANTPKPIPNLAGLDDQVVINFRAKPRHDSTTIARELRTTWRRLFLAIADKFRLGHAYAAIDHPLEEFIHAEQVRYYYITFTSTERLRILNQLELLGLMQSSTGKSVDGKPGVFYTLTAKGDEIRLVGKAVLRS